MDSITRTNLRKRLDISTLRHHTERDISLASYALEQFKECGEIERLNLALFYTQAALETIDKRISRLKDAL
jgi:hypothetical protein